METEYNSPPAGHIRLGIIGFGNIGRQHFQAALATTGLEVVAIADPIAADGLPEDIRSYRQWQELLAHPHLDAISICAPHDLHAPIALSALDAGKHVLVEKPLALTVREGKELLHRAQRRERVLMVEMTHRFYPALREARAFVEAGHLGTIYAVEDRIVEPAGRQIQPWLQDKARAGGGVALTNGVHMLDRIAALTGQKLKFVCGSAGYSAHLGNIEDTAAMLLSLENGSPVQVLAAWPMGNATCDDELTVYGSLGTLRVWAWRGWRFEPLSAKNAPLERLCHAPEEPLATRVQNGVRAALGEFAAAIREHRDPHPTAQTALEAQELIEQFYRCAQCAPFRDLFS